MSIWKDLQTNPPKVSGRYLMYSPSSELVQLVQYEVTHKQLGWYTHWTEIPEFKI
jgi:hypothetical protein